MSSKRITWWQRFKWWWKCDGYGYCHCPNCCVYCRDIEAGGSK